jgi:DNA modification methylase
MINFLQGDVFDKLKELDDNSIDCVVTSPPYWGLRDYGTAKWQGGNPNCEHKKSRFNYSISDKQKSNNGNSGLGAYKNGEFCKCGAKRIDKQLGLEPTYQEHIQNIVELFRAIKPKLKDSATIWLNYGDSYAATVNGTKAKDIKNDDRGFVDKPFSTIQGALKPKDLVMLPNRIAIALQDDGWWIRSEIIWHKPNPMPESVTDRPTNAHEKIWLITKSKKYYYDANAIKEVSSTQWNSNNFSKQIKLKETNKWTKMKNFRQGKGYHSDKIQSGRNKRNVWTVTTKPFKDAHFATFPKDLIEPCIKAGCPEKVCSECKTPYTKKPIYEYNTKVTNKNNNHGKYKNQETESTYRQGLHSKRGNKLIEVRDNLPNQKDFVKFLREKTTLNDLVENTDIEKTTIEHWFRNDEAGFAFPSVKDWNKIRDLVNDWTKEFNDIDNGLTCIQYKTDSVQSKEIIDFKLEKSCDCKTNKFESGVVFDPFGGAGTTGIVAQSLNRKSIMIELNPEYIKIAKKRIEKELGLFG